jgi:hypothetical protein
MQIRSGPWVLPILLWTTGCGLLGATPERRASLTVANHSNWPICSIHVSPHQPPPTGRHAQAAPAERAWSEDLLPAPLTIEPGFARTVSVPAGRWDLRMDDCRARTLYAQQGMRIDGAVALDFRPIRVERPAIFSRRRVAGGSSPPGRGGL